MPGRPPRGRLLGASASIAVSAPVALAALAAMLACVALAGVAADVPEHRVKAELVERFTRYIEWPGTSGDETRPFQICLWGSSPLGAELFGVTAGRKIKSRDATVRVVSRLPDLDPCHVVFIPGSSADSLERILLRTTGKPILTVGDTEGYARRGVLINFYVEERHVRFEVNETAARRSGLAMSSRLLKLARVLPPEESP